MKHGAASLGSNQPDSQVMVMNAVKDVAAALGELINATKLASGKPINDPAMNDLKDSAKVCCFLYSFFLCFLSLMLSFSDLRFHIYSLNVLSIIFPQTNLNNYLILS